MRAALSVSKYECDLLTASREIPITNHHELPRRSVIASDSMAYRWLTVTPVFDQRVALSNSPFGEFDTHEMSRSVAADGEPRCDSGLVRLNRIA
jgi:hypothetical protein